VSRLVAAALRHSPTNTDDETTAFQKDHRGRLESAHDIDYKNPHPRIDCPIFCDPSHCSPTFAMTSVVKGFGAPSIDANGNGNSGTEFLCMLSPPKDKVDGYDNTIPCSQQSINVPALFRDAMSVREQVYGEQGIPLEAEFDEDDARSWHWIAYASVASTSTPPKYIRSDSANTPADDARRASASASRMPVATIRLIPPPHGPNKYLDDANKADKHGDADPPSEELQRAHPAEPYVKLGRLATLKPYRGMGLAGLLVNAVSDFAKLNPDTIYKPPSPTALERAQIKEHGKEQQLAWEGLIMIHAQANLKKMWEKHGFSEELKNDNGEVEIAAEPHWVEEGIEHIGMWKRIDVKRGRSGMTSTM
jgi:predicted GNAT family N-acyltransferase